MYDHRCAIYIALCNQCIKDNQRYTVWKSKFHTDGSYISEWFIAGIIDLSNGKQISYHLPDRLFEQINVTPLERGKIWDGHTSKDVIERLINLK